MRQRKLLCGGLLLFNLCAGYLIWQARPKAAPLYRPIVATISKEPRARDQAAVCYFDGIQTVTCSLPKPVSDGHFTVLAIEYGRGAGVMSVATYVGVE
jgi:hypothetical protein